MPPVSSDESNPLQQQPRNIEQNEPNPIFHNSGETTARKVLTAANKVIDNAAPTVNHIIQLTSKAATTTFDAGRKMYHNINDNPTAEKMLQWTEKVVGSAAETTSKTASKALAVGKQAYQSMADSPITGPVVRFTGATSGSALLLSVWAKALTSRAARQVLRATCIKSSIRMFTWLQLPASLRAAAVASGVHANNFIISGVVPGLFTVWAIHDGYRLVRLTYELLQDQEMLSEPRSKL